MSGLRAMINRLKSRGQLNGCVSKAHWASCERLGEPGVDHCPERGKQPSACAVFAKHLWNINGPTISSRAPSDAMHDNKVIVNVYAFIAVDQTDDIQRIRKRVCRQLQLAFVGAVVGAQHEVQTWFGCHLYSSAPYLMNVVVSG